LAPSTSGQYVHGSAFEFVVLGILDHHYGVADQQLRVDARLVGHQVALAELLGIERGLVEADPGRANAQSRGVTVWRWSGTGLTVRSRSARPGCW
jgi:hypothetical protein